MSDNNRTAAYIHEFIGSRSLVYNEMACVFLHNKGAFGNSDTGPLPKDLSAIKIYKLYRADQGAQNPGCMSSKDLVWK